MLNSSIWPIDRTQVGATTLGQNEPGSNSDEGILHIPKSSRTGASPLDEMQFSVKSRTLVGRGLTPLQICSQCILLLQPIERHKDWQYLI